VTIAKERHSGMPQVAVPLKARRLKYVLVTPARNEAEFIEGTIRSVITQTVPPEKWVIVSDGSTDGTDQIVQRYAGRYPFIELLRMAERSERHFAGKVHAFNAGYATLVGVDYDVIGSLDADITFDPEYLEFLLEKFQQNPRLGVAGTPFREGTQQYDYRFTSIEHVSGACQLFRGACFEDIGGYVPRHMGGIDLVAVITARMKGWETRSFPEKVSLHHRTMGTAGRGVLRSHFLGGRGDYLLGTHPVWELCRSVYQIVKPPFFLGAALRLSGFVWAMLTRLQKQVPTEFTEFRRQEQMRRLREFLRRPIPVRNR
jgi:glycosyltransferase involved in cell wall biosynthesis